MSDGSVITNDEVKGWLKKDYCVDEFRCKFAIMNPELTYTLPAWQTACGITDMMMHTMERYFSKDDDMETTDAIAEAVKDTGILIGNLGWIRRFTDAGVKVYGDYGLNVFNEQARKAFEDIGVELYMPSHETGLSDEGGNTTGYRLYSLEDLENGIFNVKMDDLTSEMELCSGSCLLSGFGYPRTESTIYDGNLTPVLTTKGWVRPALDGTYYLRRGPWHGFIDGNGNWLIRENYADE